MSNKETYYYQEARRKVKMQSKFYKSMLVWLLVSGFLFFLNFKTSPQYLWAVFPFLGWGLGILIQGFRTFGFPLFMKNSWVQRKIEEEMLKMHAKDVNDNNEHLQLPRYQEELDLDDFKRKSQQQYQPNKKWRDSDLV